MRASVLIHQPDNVEVSITFRMSLGAWKKLADQLADKGLSWQYPASDFFNEINVLRHRMEKELLASTPAQEIEL